MIGYLVITQRTARSSTLRSATVEREAKNTTEICERKLEFHAAGILPSRDLRFSFNDQDPTQLLTAFFDTLIINWNIKHRQD